MVQNVQPNETGVEILATIFVAAEIPSHRFRPALQMWQS
jgi:hypothetical protein